MNTERKRRLRAALDTDRTRMVARALTNAMIESELVAIRLTDFTRTQPEHVEAGTLTAIIKTFERPREVRRLVKSLRRLAPEIRVVVADDSRRPVRIDGAETVVLPYNSGVSAGRNAALNQVATPFFVMLDDDFLVGRMTELKPALTVMQTTPEIDVIGGIVVNLPDFRTTDYSTAGLFPTGRPPIAEPGSLVGGLPARLKVANFFIGRTETVREVGWTDELKFIDHMDFFTRACGRLTVVQDDRLVALHARNPFDRASPERLANVEESWAVLNRRYGRNMDQ